MKKKNKKFKDVWSYSIDLSYLNQLRDKGAMPTKEYDSLKSALKHKYNITSSFEAKQNVVKK